MSVGMHCKMSANMARPLSIPLLDGSEEGPLLQTVYSSLSFQSVKGPSPNLRCAGYVRGWGGELKVAPLVQLLSLMTFQVLQKCLNSV